METQAHALLQQAGNWASFRVLGKYMSGSRCSLDCSIPNYTCLSKLYASSLLFTLRLPTLRAASPRFFLLSLEGKNILLLFIVYSTAQGRIFDRQV